MDETIPPLPAEQPLGLASRISAIHMTTCLPLSLSRIFRIACCLMGAVAAILMTTRVVSQQPAFLTNGLVAYYPFNANANYEIRIQNVDAKCLIKFKAAQIQ